MAVDSNNNVYAGGIFTSSGSNAINRIAKWNGSEWSALGDGFNNTVNALAVDSNNNVYAGGNFIRAGGVSANRIAELLNSSIADVYVNNNFITTLINNQYQCVNYYNSNGYIYRVANGYR